MKYLVIPCLYLKSQSVQFQSSMEYKIASVIFAIYYFRLHFIESVCKKKIFEEKIKNFNKGLKKVETCSLLLMFILSGAKSKDIISRSLKVGTTSRNY